MRGEMGGRGVEERRGEEEMRRWRGEKEEMRRREKEMKGWTTQCWEGYF